MMTGVDDESELTWDEAAALFEHGEPAVVVRTPRKILVEYRHVADHWEARSPDLTGFAVRAQSLAETRSLVRADLGPFLDDSVTISEDIPDQIATYGSGIFDVTRGPDQVVHLVNGGRRSVRADVSASLARA
jgi:hypothetical protein